MYIISYDAFEHKTTWVIDSGNEAQYFNLKCITLYIKQMR